MTRKKAPHEAAGWRRSADRARLHAISLLSGNFTGKITISGLRATILKQETTAPQRLFSKFPKQTIREISPKNREFQADNREFSRQICKRPFLARLRADVEKCPTLIRPPNPGVSPLYSITPSVRASGTGRTVKSSASPRSLSKHQLNGQAADQRLWRTSSESAISNRPIVPDLLQGTNTIRLQNNSCQPTRLGKCCPQEQNLTGERHASFRRTAWHPAPAES